MSAKDGTHVNEAFLNLTKKILERKAKSKKKQEFSLLDITKKEKGGMCCKDN